jgi:peptide deformylase
MRHPKESEKVSVWAWNRATLLWVLSLLVISLVSASCAANRIRYRGPIEDDRLDSTERKAIVLGDSGQPMNLVTLATAPGNQWLRNPSQPIEPSDPLLPRLLSRMLATVQAEGGVGIAAPQVGLHRRVILVQRLDKPGKPFVAYLNPTVVHFSSDQGLDWEGCLSIPEGFGKVARALSLNLSYDTKDGSRQEEAVTEYVARIFQHEVDHLDGILFIDRKEPGPLMPKEEYRKMRAAEKKDRPAARDP